MVKIEEMLQLMEAVNKNGLTCVKLEEGDTKVIIEKKQQTVVTNTVQTAKAAAVEHSNPITYDTAEEAVMDNIITSPLVGIFYSSTAPGAEPLVKAGDSVKKGQVLGIIEAMKLMNEIESEYDGVIEAVLVNNEDTVEYGQPLFRIR